MWDKIQRKNLSIKKNEHQELHKSFGEDDMVLFVKKACSTSKKKTQKLFTSTTVLFIATVECLTVGMRWCYVLPAKVGFTESAKWVIFTTHIGSAKCAVSSCSRVTKECL